MIPLPPPGARRLNDLSLEELANPEIAQTAWFTLDLDGCELGLPERYLGHEEKAEYHRANWAFQVANMDSDLDPADAARMERAAEREMGRLEELAWQRRDEQRDQERRAAQGGQIVRLPALARTRSRARAPRTSAGSRARRAAVGARAGPGDDGGDSDGGPCSSAYAGLLGGQRPLDPRPPICLGEVRHAG